LSLLIFNILYLKTFSEVTLAKNRNFMEGKEDISDKKGNIANTLNRSGAVYSGV